MGRYDARAGMGGGERWNAMWRGVLGSWRGMEDGKGGWSGGIWDGLDEE